MHNPLKELTGKIGSELGLVTPQPFERQINFKFIGLEGRVTHQGFKVSNRDAEFSYLAPKVSNRDAEFSYLAPRNRFFPSFVNNENSSHYLDILDKKRDKNYIFEKPIKEFKKPRPPRDYVIGLGLSELTATIGSPNSTLVIRGMPDVVMQTHYTPGQLTVVQAREAGEVWQIGGVPFIIYSKEKGTISGKGLTLMAQRAATKALKDLQLDYAHREFERMRLEAVRADILTPGERTLATYLAK